MRTKMLAAFSMLAAPTALMAQSVPAEPVQHPETRPPVPTESDEVAQMRASNTTEEATPNASVSENAQAQTADNSVEDVDHAKNKNREQPD